LPGLFPEARLAPDRRSLRCADLSGRPPRKEGSCTIHLDGPYAGWGFDYATGERAGPIDLIAHGLPHRVLSPHLHTHTHDHNGGHAHD